MLHPFTKAPSGVPKLASLKLLGHLAMRVNQGLAQMYLVLAAKMSTLGGKAIVHHVRWLVQKRAHMAVVTSYYSPHGHASRNCGMNISVTLIGINIRPVCDVDTRD